MANYVVGTTTVPIFWTETVFSGFNYGSVVNTLAGLHTFTLGAGSNIQVTGGEINIGEDEPLVNFTGILAQDRSVWKFSIQGSVYVSIPDEGGQSGSGISLFNGGSSGTGKGLSTVAIGADANVFGAFAGIDSMTAAKITNFGVIGGGQFGAYFASFGADLSDSNLHLSANGAARTIAVSNAAAGVISGGDAGIYNESSSSLIITNAGAIYGGQRSFVLGGDDLGYTSFSEFAIYSGGQLRLTNTAAGTIEGGVRSLWLGSTVVNAGIVQGTIEAWVDQTFEFLDNGVWRLNANRNLIIDKADLLITDLRLVGLTVTNSGIIDGYDRFIIRGGVETPGNDTAWKVAIDGSQVRDVITNSAAGTILGEVNLGAGSDRIINLGLIDGYIAMGDGNDYIYNTAKGVISTQYDDAINMGEGNDTIVNLGSIDHEVYMGAGSDSITNNGLIGSIFMDILADIDGNILMAPNGDGDDRLTLSAKSNVDGFVYLGFGNNAVANAGRISGTTLRFAEDGSVVNGLIVGRDGNDTLTNTSTGQILGAVHLGDGNNVLTNTGRIVGDLSALSDVESGAFLSLVTMGAGNDRLTNTGTIGEISPMFFGYRTTTTNLYTELMRALDLSLGIAIDMGAGHDLVNNARGRIFGAVDMGAGNDIYVGGAGTDIVIEGAGLDRYTLGVGADALTVVSLDAFADTLDGGLGLDLIWFDTSDISEDPGAVPPLGHRIDLAAKRVIYEVTGFADSVGGNHGIDSIASFEQVIGSAGKDYIIGAAAAETLSGAGGDDVIFGGGGKDLLVGGAGADTFVFQLASDSGRTRVTRDIIQDFSTAEDTIALSFDSNTRAGTANAGIQQDFVFVGMNTGFLTAAQMAEQDYGIAAQVRAYWAGGATVVEIDTNGDRRADVTIELTGQVSLASDDFVFGLANVNAIL